MKILKVSFIRPVRVRGDMVTSLSSSLPVGRAGAFQNVDLVLSDDNLFVKVIAGGAVLRIVPIFNVSDFEPAPEPVVPAPAKK